MRATLRLSSPAWLAQPRKTSSSCDQSTFGLRAISALIGPAGEIVGAHLGERAAIAADGGARGVADEDLAHRSLLEAFVLVQAIYGPHRTGSNGSATTGIPMDKPASAAEFAPLPPTLRAERQGAVAVLKLARAEKRNALDDATVLGIEAFFRRSPTASAPWCWPAKATISAPVSISPN